MRALVPIAFVTLSLVVGSPVWGQTTTAPTTPEPPAVVRLACPAPDSAAQPSPVISCTPAEPRWPIQPRQAE
jgi:hypothetical protein